MCLERTTRPFLVDTSPSVSECTWSSPSGRTFFLVWFFRKLQRAKVLNTSASVTVPRLLSSTSFASRSACFRLRFSAIGDEQQRKVPARVPIRERQVVKGPVAPQKFEQQPVCRWWKPGNHNGEPAEASRYVTGLFQSAAAQRVGAGPHSEPIGSVGATRGVNAIA